jgi:hypothetical protein
MSLTELQILVGSALTLIVLAIVALKLWPNQRIDMFRQNMFSLRDELFDFAADGNISFEAPAYKLLRQLMNGYIRYAHNLTPYRTLMAFLQWKYSSSQTPLNAWAELWNKTLSEVDDQELKKKLEQYHSRSAMLVVSQLVLSPGLLICVAPLAVIVAIIYTQWTNLRGIYNDIKRTVPISFLEEQAAKS